MHWWWPVEPRRRWRRWLRLLEQRLWEDQMHWQMHCYLVASCGGGLAEAAEVMVINDMIGNHMPQVQVTQKLMAVRR